MGEPLLKTKNGKVIGLAIFIVIATGIYFYIVCGVRKEFQSQVEEISQTEKLPENVKHLLSGATFNDDNKAFSDMVIMPVDNTIKYSFTKYLYFADDILGASKPNTKLEAIYDRRINDLLSTSGNLNGNTLDGIILRKTNSVQVGVYKGKGDIPALKPYYTLTFVKLPEQIVVKRDTVWGQDPDEQIEISDGHRIGNEPKNEEVVSAIKKSLSKK